MTRPRGSVPLGLKLTRPGSRGEAVFERAFERPKTAHFLRIQTSHVTGPDSSSVNGRPATLRASFI